MGLDHFNGYNTISILIGPDWQINLSFLGPSTADKIIYVWFYEYITG